MPFFRRSVGTGDRGKLLCTLPVSYTHLVAFAEKYGVQNVFTSFEEVCADPAVDIIYISTPHNTHIQFLRKALAAGKPVSYTHLISWF